MMKVITACRIVILLLICISCCTCSKAKSVINKDITLKTYIATRNGLQRDIAIGANANPCIKKVLASKNLDKGELTITIETSGKYMRLRFLIGLYDINGRYFNQFYTQPLYELLKIPADNLDKVDGNRIYTVTLIRKAAERDLQNAIIVEVGYAATKH